MLSSSSEQMELQGPVEPTGDGGCDQSGNDTEDDVFLQPEPDDRHTLVRPRTTHWNDTSLLLALFGGQAKYSYELSS